MSLHLSHLFHFSLILHQSVLTTVSIGEEGRYVAECAHLKCYSDLSAQEHVQTMTFHESLDRSITFSNDPFGASLVELL